VTTKVIGNAEAVREWSRESGQRNSFAFVHIFQCVQVGVVALQSRTACVGGQVGYVRARVLSLRFRLTWLLSASTHAITLEVESGVNLALSPTSTHANTLD